MAVEHAWTPEEAPLRIFASACHHHVHCFAPAVHILFNCTGSFLTRLLGPASNYDHHRFKDHAEVLSVMDSFSLSLSLSLSLLLSSSSIHIFIFRSPCQLSPAFQGMAEGRAKREKASRARASAARPDV